MHDAFITRSLRLTLALLIAGVAFGCLILSYQAMFELIAGAFRNSAVKFAWGSALATAALLLLHYRGDLIDDES
jgi:hypothetical protein